MADLDKEIGSSSNFKQRWKQVATNVYAKMGSAGSVRNAGVLHRTGITAVDKIAVPTAVTAADVATGGSLLASTTYKANIAANTLFGATSCPTAASQATAADASNTHVIRLTTTQVTNAVSYEIFLSTDAAPLWVARITEAQRAAGCTVTALGTVTATSPGANKVDVQAVGTGVASTAAPFGFNNAMLLSGITPIDCSGYTTARVFTVFSATDLRALPTLVLGFYDASSANAGVYCRLTGATISFANAVGAPFIRATDFSVLGCTQFLVAIDTISGTGASVEIYVDLI